MSINLGVHAGPQDLTMSELKRLWSRADEAGFHWISVWDHFYANPLTDRNNPCFEGVAIMAALAALTTNVRVGCLMFCVPFRPPGVLAKAAVTIDHISGGRAEIGVGAGWFEEEFREFGYGFPPLGTRLDQLEEALQILRSLWREPVTHFDGKHYALHGAVCGPKPLNPNMPVWIGGRGERRTPRIAARYADGFNMPYLPPEQVADRLERLRMECERIDRDVAEVDTSVNVGFYMNSPRQPDVGAAGSLVGGTQEVIDKIGAYVDTGVKGLNIAFRPPVDWEAFEAYIEDVLPEFRGAD